jgi:hypothetical protein
MRDHYSHYRNDTQKEEEKKDTTFNKSCCTDSTCSCSAHCMCMSDGNCPCEENHKKCGCEESKEKDEVSKNDVMPQTECSFMRALITLLEEYQKSCSGMNTMKR